MMNASVDDERIYRMCRIQELLSVFLIINMLGQHTDVDEQCPQSRLPPLSCDFCQPLFAGFFREYGGNGAYLIGKQLVYGGKSVFHKSVLLVIHDEDSLSDSPCACEQRCADRSPVARHSVVFWP